MPSLVLERAAPEDDRAIRALLARMPMDGDIRLTFEREPDSALSASVEGDRHHAFVARDASGAVAGLCSRAVRRVFANGREARIGYLGQLRLDQPVAGRLQLLVDGFELCRATRKPDELPFDVTSIMADNVPARRLLERGLPGLPRYTPLAGFKTLLIPVSQPRGVSDGGIELARGSEERCGDVAAFLQREYSRFQLAPVWTETDLLSDETTRDLSLEDFVLAMVDGRIVGCGALWDQSNFRQTVVRGYSPRVARLRHVANAWNRLTRSPLLPPVGSPIRMAMVSHFAFENDDPRAALLTLGRLMAIARSKGVDYVVLGLADRHPLLPSIERRLRCRVLESILYAVQYDEGMAPQLDGRIPHLEVATL